MKLCRSLGRPGTVACSLLLLLTHTLVMAATPRLVRDINPIPQPISSTPADFFDLGATLHFSAIDGVNGYEPWTTDGTAEGTFVWGDVVPGQSGARQHPVRAGGLSYIVLNHPNRPPALWVSDGTPQGTRRVDVTAWASTASNADVRGVFGDLLALSVHNRTTGDRELWLSDGTDAGTRLVSGRDGDRYTLATPTVVGGSRLFFLGLRQGIYEPWISDGTAQGTYRLAEIPGAVSGSTGELVAAGDFIFFTASTSAGGHELWRIDTRDLTVAQVADIAPGSASALNSNSRMGRVGDVVVFAASPSGDTDMNLWRSDGTAAGTFQISDLDVVQSASPAYFGAGSRVLFYALGGGGSQQLWATDGTTPGTQQLRDSYSFPLFQVADRFYFGDSNPTVLWSSDGTTAGTRMLNGIIGAQEKLLDVAGTSDVLFVRTVGQALGGPGHLYRHDLAAGTTTTLTRYEMENAAIVPHMLSYARGRLFFDNVGRDTGRELWISDGTVNGTRMFMNLAPETRTFDSSPANLLRFGNRLIFTAEDGSHGREVWSSDGTDAGTQMLVDATPGSEGSEPTNLFVAGNALYFFARDAATNYQLWRSDGSAAGTRILAAISPSEFDFGIDCHSRGVTLPNGDILFPGYDDARALRLWRSDGTTGGTIALLNLSPPGASGGLLCNLTAVGDQVYFQASSAEGRELWRSDGTAAGTQRVTDLFPSFRDSKPRSLTDWNGVLYFIADNDQGVHLWTSDGSSQGTRIAASFPDDVPHSIAGILGGKLLISVQEFSGAVYMQPWVFANGAATLLSSSLRIQRPEAPLVQNGLALFPAFSSGPPASDQEPWVTDGTPEGTRMLLNTHPGYSSPASFTDFHGVTLFETEVYPEPGKQLWRTNGSAASTRSIGAFSLGAERVAANQHLFYVSTDAAVGAELFVIDNERPTASDDQLGPVQSGQSISAAILGNDSDADGGLDVASVAIVTAPAGGSVNIVDGQITYSARTGFSGADSFTYTVADDQGYASTPATVRVNVTTSTNPSNEPPPSGGGGGGGGGGSMPLSQLCVLALLAALARRRALFAR